MSLLITVLLVAAVALFALACTRFARGWFVPLGLACWALTALLPRLL